MTMNANEFTKELITRYQKNNGRELSYEDLGSFLCEIIESNGGLYSVPLNKKTAARIIHEFQKNVLKLPDLDWGDATAFLDIYDCKVCANALAQCYLRGYISPVNEKIIGGDEIITDPESIISRFC